MAARRLGWRVRLPHGRRAVELLLNGIPQWRIDDRRVLARMELVLVNDLASVNAVLQHQVERAGRERLAADEATGNVHDLLLIPSSARNKRTEPSTAWRRKINRTASASLSIMTSLWSCTPYPSGGTPPIHIPYFFEAAIFSGSEERR